MKPRWVARIRDKYTLSRFKEDFQEFLKPGDIVVIEDAMAKALGIASWSFMSSAKKAAPESALLFSNSGGSNSKVGERHELNFGQIPPEFEFKNSCVRLSREASCVIAAWAELGARINCKMAALFRFLVSFFLGQYSCYALNNGEHNKESSLMLDRNVRGILSFMNITVPHLSENQCAYTVKETFKGLRRLKGATRGTFDNDCFDDWAAAMKAQKGILQVARFSFEDWLVTIPQIWSKDWRSYYEEIMEGTRVPQKLIGNLKFASGGDGTRWISKVFDLPNVALEKLRSAEKLEGSVKKLDTERRAKTKNICEGQPQPEVPTRKKLIESLDDDDVSSSDEELLCHRPPKANVYKQATELLQNFKPASSMADNPEGQGVHSLHSVAAWKAATTHKYRSSETKKQKGANSTKAKKRKSKSGKVPTVAKRKKQKVGQTFLNSDNEEEDSDNEEEDYENEELPTCHSEEDDPVSEHAASEAEEFEMESVAAMVHGFENPDVAWCTWVGFTDRSDETMSGSMADVPKSHLGETTLCMSQTEYALFITGNQLVGKTIRVRWSAAKLKEVIEAEGHKMRKADAKCLWFEGKITKFSARNRKHTVVYADGDKEELNLSDLSQATVQAWELAPYVCDKSYNSIAPDLVHGTLSSKTTCQHCHKSGDSGWFKGYLISGT